jgi:hypothetical protein
MRHRRRIPPRDREKPFAQAFRVSGEARIPAFFFAQMVQKPLANIRRRRAKRVSGRRFAAIAHSRVLINRQIQVVRQSLRAFHDTGTNGWFWDLNLSEKMISILVRQAAKEVLIQNIIPFRLEFAPSKPLSPKDRDKRAWRLLHERAEPSIGPQSLACPPRALAALQLFMRISHNNDTRRVLRR